MSAPETEALIEFSVIVREGSKVKFESTLSQPLTADHKAASEAWFDMMHAGMRVAQALRALSPAAQSEGGEDV